MDLYVTPSRNPSPRGRDFDNKNRKNIWFHKIFNYLYTQLVRVT